MRNIELLIELRKEKESLLSMIQPVLDKVKAIDSVLELYEFAQEKIVEEKQDVITKATVHAYGEFNDKILRIIRNKGVGIKAPVISETIFGNKATTDQRNDVSGALNYLRKQGKVDRYKINDNNNMTYWGLKAWFNDKGELKSEHSPSPNVFVSFNGL